MPILAALKRNPSAGLLLVQVAGLLLYPFMDASPRSRALFGAFGLVVLGLALWVVRRSPFLTWLGLLLAAPVVLLAIVNTITPNADVAVVMAGLEAVFYFYAAGSLIAYMLQDTVVRADELFAAGATFTLLAWAFAYTFVVCQAAIPGSFGAEQGWIELLYVSVAVLSSVGLSDIVPVLPMARGLVMIESIAGIMYIAIVVSRLISLTTFARAREQ